MIGVRLQPDDLELLDLWIKANNLDLSRPEAMRRILRMVAVRVPK
jgi:type II secretory pathway component PulC